MDPVQEEDNESDEVIKTEMFMPSEGDDSED